ncbi:hypothetical protein EV702DRAFT_1194859 [Suillus placidus]|uniref:RING-type domain-containing protein n=1 Tax=Suillus placidus TaxID=48579 RepID=A0A9P7D4M0_9AGAM|nr:hypothetical protein EV702DRAFT_1194859 [Suillus placidus]
MLSPNTKPNSKHSKLKSHRPRNPTSIFSLTAHPPSQASSLPKKAKPPSPKAPPADDLTSTLTCALSTHPYPDCPICFNPIRPEHHTWSCSSSDPSENLQCCWNTFHLKCIRAWASKSVKDLQDAWRARGEDRTGEWRCPGCQAKRESVPSSYRQVLLSSYHRSIPYSLRPPTQLCVSLLPPLLLVATAVFSPAILVPVQHALLPSGRAVGVDVKSRRSIVLPWHLQILPLVFPAA